MTKGKYKRKKQKAENNTQHASEQMLVMKQEEDSEMPTDHDAQGARKTGVRIKGAQTSTVGRFIQHMKTPLFTNQCIAVFTAGLVWMAVDQFIVIRNQLKVMRIDQRAWVSVREKNGISAIAVGATPQVELVFSDTGKTPATKVIAHFFIEVVPNGEKPHFEEETAHSKMLSGVIEPNSPQEMLVYRHRVNSVEGDVLLDSEKKALDDGKAWMAVHGIVFYNDVFDAQHWLRFCQWSYYKPGYYQADSCTEYDSIDNQ